jgi:hypothetical protein
MKFDAFDWLVFAFFLSHIPITICIDAQAVMPPELYPKALRELIAWYIATLKDPLFAAVARKDPSIAWFQSIVFVEVAAQLPFFFVALAGWRKSWVRIPAIVYGVHTATTLVPILGTFFSASLLSASERAVLCGIYMPYLVMPVLIAWRAASRPAMFVETIIENRSKLS